MHVDLLQTSYFFHLESAESESNEWVCWNEDGKTRELRKLIILPLGLSNMSDLFTKVANIFRILDVWYSYKERHSGLQHD